MSVRPFAVTAQLSQGTCGSFILTMGLQKQCLAVRDFENRC